MVTVGLVMIVKDEAKILPRLAESVRDHIDYYTIVDTGSTDDTLEVIHREFGNEGQAILHEFDGFGPSRSVALKAAEKNTDWMLVLDADETFHGHISLLDEGGDCLEAEQRSGSMRFWLPRLLRSGCGWESRGRAHEHYVSATAGLPIRQGDFYVEHHADGHNRSEKFQRDIELLWEDWEDHERQARPPVEDMARTAFYLGRSYEDDGQCQDAAIWYRRRLGLGGWPEETFYARYRLGMCLLNTGAAEEGCGYLWRSWGEQPHRAEPLIALAAYYRGIEQWLLAYQAAELAFSWCHAQPGNFAPGHDGLFVDVTAVGWKAAYEQSISAWYTGHKERGRRLSEWLQQQELPEPYAVSVLENARFYD
jgi:glycosyltransferase involved in cell wall biosynthesis